MPRDFVSAFAEEPEKTQRAATPKPAYLQHTVRWPGESLSLIAKWYTGSLDNWKALAEANPELNPERITMGAKIHIPEDMLQTRDPMPQDFVTSMGQKPDKASPDRETAEEAQEKPRLFGPKRYPSE
jgi:hypothetical protein